MIDEFVEIPKRIRVNLTGERFGKLIVKSFHRVGKRGQVYWKCFCECGNICYTETQSLKRGTKSCGCWVGESASIRNSTHGCKRNKKPTPEYSAWDSAKYRTSPQSKDANNYFHRGITMCDRWKESFEHFLEDMGPKPSPQHSIDRINNNGPYSPENCRWATAKEQVTNRTTTVFVEYNGVTLCVSHWAELKGMDDSTLANRLKKGWSVEEALTKPVRPWNRKGMSHDS